MSNARRTKQKPRSQRLKVCKESLQKVQTGRGGRRGWDADNE